MDDCSLENLNEKEKGSLDTITIQYGLRKTNTEFPTRVQSNSMSLINSFRTNLPELEKFRTVV